MAFLQPAVNNCGGNCSAFSVPFTEKPESVNKDNPDGNICPQNNKLSIKLEVCYVDLECDSIELGCTKVIAGSVKRNFRQKSTTLFVGFGDDVGLGKVEFGAEAGLIFTGYDKGDIDFGIKLEVDANYGTRIKGGVNVEATYTLLEGFRDEKKMVTVIGF